MLRPRIRPQRPLGCDEGSQVAGVGKTCSNEPGSNLKDHKDLGSFEEMVQIKGGNYCHRSSFPNQGYGVLSRGKNGLYRVPRNSKRGVRLLTLLQGRDACGHET